MSNSQLQSVARLCRKRAQRLWYYGVASLLGLAVTAGANPQGGPPAQQAPAVAAPLDDPLRLIDNARRSMEGIRDYTCLLVKRERLRGELQPENLVSMKVRNRPFCVYMRWLRPKQFDGQEVCYMQGKNNGQMRAQSPGILGLAGFISVDVDDPRVIANSRHTILEAGIGNLIERMAKAWEQERAWGLTQVSLADYEYNRRRCTRVETIHPTNPGNRFTSYRTVMYFDKEHHLPIRIEVYDWPRQGGSRDGELLEVYSYADLKLNVGLKDETFNY